MPTGQVLAARAVRDAPDRTAVLGDKSNAFKGLGIPDAQRAVVAAARQVAPRGMEAQADNPPLVAHEVTGWLTRRQVPQSDRPTIAGTHGEKWALPWTDRDRTDKFGMLVYHIDGL